MVKKKNIPVPELYALLLIGGQSTRMQTDKAALNYHGIAQGVYLYQLLKECTPEVYVSRQKNPLSFKLPKSVKFIYDPEKYKDMGPLSGILSAMELYPKAAWLVVACDLPFLTLDCLKDLIENRNPSQPATAYQSHHDRLPEPLCAIYEPGIYNKIIEHIGLGITCPRKILIRTKIPLLKLRWEHALNNINTPAEYIQAKEVFKAKTLKVISQPAKHHTVLLQNNLQSQNAGFITVHLQYFAILREQRQQAKETIVIKPQSVQQLYFDLEKQYHFSLDPAILRVAVNDKFVDWSTQLANNDHVIFIPPVAGG